MAQKKAARKGRFLNIVTKKKKLPNGIVVTVEMVKHPGAVVIIPFLPKNRLILLRQFRPVINAYIYELPAGTLEKKEVPAACARREIQEETGYAAKKITRLGAIYPVPGYSTEKISLFAAEGLTPVAVCCEEDEVIDPRVFTRAQIKKLFRAGKIVDAKTICGLVMCGWL